MSLVMRKPAFCICKNKDADQLRSITAQLISAFVFGIRIVIFLFYLNMEFQATYHLLGTDDTAWFVSDLFGNPEDRFSHNEDQGNGCVNTHKGPCWRISCLWSNLNGVYSSNVKLIAALPDPSI